MSYANYNIDQYELLNSYEKVEENLNGKSPYDEKYKSYEAIQKETENLLKREHTVFIITSSITAVLVAYTLQQL
jgi:hypothetical protein